MAKKAKKSAGFVGNAGLDFGVDGKNTSSKLGVKDGQKPPKGKERKKTEEDIEFERLFGNWKDGQRYNKEQLAFFERLIVHDIEETQRNIESSRANIIPANDLTGDDRKTQIVENNVYIQKIVDQEKHKMNLKRAIIRIRTKRYGICKVSGEIIPPRRLRAVPVTTTLKKYQPK